MFYSICLIFIQALVLAMGAPDDVRYTGCFPHTQSSPGLGGATGWTISVLTPYNCINFCYEKPASYMYAGVTSGDQCWCGNSVNNNNKVSDAQCMVTRCVGDSTEFCGASNRITVYEAECFYVGFYGADCSGVCRCQDETQCHPYTGHCQESQCEAGWTGSNCQSFDPSQDICKNIETPLSTKYMGCFNHQHNEDVTAKEHGVQGGTDTFWTLTRNSPSNCIQYCLDQDPLFKYAGVTGGDECWCGLAYNVDDRIAERECQRQSCSGALSQWCGAEESMAVYRTGSVSYNCLNIGCPSKRFISGTSCSGICRCRNDSPCNWRTGNCTEGCAEGWVGAQCQTSLSGAHTTQSDIKSSIILSVAIVLLWLM